jgi:hypothetical protein
VHRARSIAAGWGGSRRLEAWTWTLIFRLTSPRPSSSRLIAIIANHCSNPCLSVANDLHCRSESAPPLTGEKILAKCNCARPGNPDDLQCLASCNGTYMRDLLRAKDKVSQSRTVSLAERPKSAPACVLASTVVATGVILKQDDSARYRRCRRFQFLVCWDESFTLYLVVELQIVFLERKKKLVQEI